MRRTRIVAVALAAVLALGGCGRLGSPGDAPAGPSPATAATETTLHSSDPGDVDIETVAGMEAELSEIEDLVADTEHLLDEPLPAR